MENSIGGITLKDVIKFQTRMLMGAQYTRIEDATETDRPCDELIIACLRIGWNDAFRHVSENQDSVEKSKKAYLDKHKSENELCVKYKKIAERKKNKEYDDYYSSVLAEDEILSIYKIYVLAESTEAKCTVINKNFDTLNKVLSQVKIEITFGHIQKLFNIATKLYLCLYMCRDYLDLDDSLFMKDMVDALKFADCPVDSVILDRYEQIKMKEKSIGEKHQLTYPDIKWSKLDGDDGIDKYQKIQDSFREESNKNNESNDSKSGLYFDFLHWGN